MRRLNEVPRLGLVVLISTIVLTGCARQVNCTDDDVIAQVSELARLKAIPDLAEQCTTKLRGKIDSLRSSCPANSDGSTESCRNACQAWAQGSINIYAEKSETVFSDETVSTKRCRARVRFTIDYDGGQTVTANVGYVIAPGLPKPQVMLSE